jgi:hypothetical protein
MTDQPVSLSLSFLFSITGIQWRSLTSTKTAMPIEWQSSEEWNDYVFLLRSWKNWKVFNFEILNFSKMTIIEYRISDGYNYFIYNCWHTQNN